MSRELVNNNKNFPPSVKFNNAGEKFVGFLDHVRDSGKFGQVFGFKVVEGTAFIGQPDGTKNEKGHNNYKNVDVKVGDIVELSTSKGGQQEQKLLQAIVGEKIEITFIGWKTNPKTGRSYKDWKVTVLD